jgi:hypothetical protein
VKDEGEKRERGRRKTEMERKGGQGDRKAVKREVEARGTSLSVRDSYICRKNFK